MAEKPRKSFDGTDRSPFEGRATRIRSQQRWKRPEKKNRRSEKKTKRRVTKIEVKSKELKG